MKFVFVADFFAEDVAGGGELNNEEAISLLREEFEVIKKKSALIDLSFLKRNKDSFFIVSGFLGMRPDVKQALINDHKYIIYEHDHKYLKSRNPAPYENFLAPKTEIVNFDLYKKSKAVLVQTSFHKQIMKKNLEIDNIISLGGNLWSVNDLENMRNLANKKKRQACSIMKSDIHHKNTADALKYCLAKKLPYTLVASKNYQEFIEALSDNDTLVFFPKTPETLSRVVVEARMMGMKVITNNLVGATREEWFELKGSSLVDVMTRKRETIVEAIKKVFLNE